MEKTCENCLYCDRIEDKALPYWGICLFFLGFIDTEDLPVWFDNKLYKGMIQANCKAWEDRRAPF